MNRQTKPLFLYCQVQVPPSSGFSNPVSKFRAPKSHFYHSKQTIKFKMNFLRSIQDMTRDKMWPHTANTYQFFTPKKYARDYGPPGLWRKVQTSRLRSLAVKALDTRDVAPNSNPTQATCCALLQRSWIHFKHPTVLHSCLLTRICTTSETEDGCGRNCLPPVKAFDHVSFENAFTRLVEWLGTCYRRISQEGKVHLHDENQPRPQALSYLPLLVVGRKRVSLPITKGGREERAWERGWMKTTSTLFFLRVTCIQQAPLVQRVG